MVKARYCFFHFQVLLAASVLSAPLASAEESGDLVGVKDLFLNFRDREGRAPTDVDLFAEVMKPGRSLTYKDMYALLEIMRQQHNPITSKEALLNLIKAKRDSIRDFQCTYSSSDTHLNNEEDSYSIECHYKMKDNMFFIDRSIHKHDGTSRQTFAYDSENSFNYAVPEPAEDGKLLPAVTIGTELNPKTFLDYQMPIYRAMLMDSRKFGLTRNHSHDLVNFLDDGVTMVCEDIEVVDDQRCVVLCNLKMRAWLSIEWDFSPVKLEVYSVKQGDFNGLNTIVGKRILIERRDFHGFKDYGNGIWLPSEINIEYYDLESGAPSVTVTNTTIASSIEINSGLKKVDFTEFIPDGTIALDGPRNLIYEWGEGTSIGGLVDDVVTRKRTSNILWYVNVTFVLLLIGIVCYRSYHRRKLGNE